MGASCCAQHPVYDESFILKVFHDQNFKLKNFNYNKLLNTLCDIRIEQSLYKKYIEELVITLFYNQNDYEFKNYHEGLCNYILSILNDKNNLYQVLMYFYPFIKHDDDENIEDNLYHIFNYANGKKKLTLKDTLNMLKKYIKFITIDLTKVIIVNSSDEYIINSFEEYNKTIFTEKHIKKFIASNMFDMLTVLGENDTITPEIFVQAVKHMKLGSFYKVRKLFLNEYGPKNYLYDSDED